MPQAAPIRKGQGRGLKCRGHYNVRAHSQKSMSKLRLSLVETGRVGGKVKHEHVASLGSLPQAMTVVDRREFWRRLEPRLAALGNRIDIEAVRALIAERAPPPSKTEIDILDLELYAEAWRKIADFFGPQEEPKRTPLRGGDARNERLREGQRTQQRDGACC
jgi:hypothetical protein